MAMDKAWRENNERLERIEQKLDAILSGDALGKVVRKELAAVLKETGKSEEKEAQTKGKAAK